MSLGSHSLRRALSGVCQIPALALLLTSLLASAAIAQKAEKPPAAVSHSGPVADPAGNRSHPNADVAFEITQKNMSA